MPVTKNAAGFAQASLDSPEGWDVPLTENWDILATINAVGGFAMVGRDLDPATLAPTSRYFNINTGMLLYRGGFTTFAAVADNIAPASATSMVWLDTAGAIQVGAGFPTHSPYVPIGAVVADADKITSIFDYRNPSVFVGMPQMISTNAAPADADIVAGVAATWYDPTDGAARVVFRARTNNGTLVTGSLSLV